MSGALVIFSVVPQSLAWAQGAALDSKRGVGAADGDLPTTNAPPLPRHSAEAPAAPSATRPEPARDDRGEPEHSLRGPRRLPIPGQPARDLPEPGEPPAEDGEPAGLLPLLPHQSFGGGVTAEYIYTGESFTLARGGMSGRRASNYRGNLDLVVTLDTELAGLWDGGRFFVYGQNIHGRPLSQSDVGDVQLFSNIDSTVSDTQRPYFTAVAEYWYEHFLWDDQLRLKVGKQDANADFAYSDLAGDFIHSSFGLPPTVPLPTFPSQALGAAAFVQLTEAVQLGVGAYDGTSADGPQGVRWGFDTLGDNGAIILSQLELLTQYGPNGQLPVTVRVGWWWHSSNDQWTDFTPEANTFSSNDGGWLIGDVMLWKEEFGTDDVQGLGAFGSYSWTRQDRNQIRTAYAAGLVYRGLVDGRDEDLLGVGVAVANFSDHFLAAERDAGSVLGTREIATEVFYKCLLTPYLIVQPEIQFITRPSGEFQDALLAGVRFEAAL